MLPTRADKKTRQLVQKRTDSSTPRIERKKRRTSLQRCAERKKFAKRRERSLAFLLFTECVKETEYKGLIKIK